MREEIKEWESKNGNSEFTNKDMLKYLAAKIDKIDERLEEGSGKISTIREGLKNLKALSYVFATAVVSVIVWILLEIR